MSENGSNVRQRVSEVLLISDRIGSAIIEVEDSGGIITLSGTIKSERERLAAETLARKQKGVVDVINNLEVESVSRSYQIRGGRY